ncbi:MAG: hypothetical protein J5772_07715, partial [Clostridia bacterium]|nr:hypothetical protein [Clostridia bacterium]
KQKLEEAARKLSNAADGLPARSASAPADDAARRRQQEELKRRLKENAERRAAERARTYASSEGASMQQRKPLEKQELRRDTARSEKPIVASVDDDCSGGSIHDGYHEGVTQFSPDRPAAVAGRLGHRLADEDERLEKEAAAVANARRVMARISKLPPLSQGMVYSEILGKPRSETA